MAKNQVLVTYADKQHEKQAHEENNQKVTAGQAGNAAASKVKDSTYGNSVQFDMDTDYTTEIADAVARGDLAQAAELEQQRNAKIEHMNAESPTGVNQWNAKPSYEYSAYLGANSEKVNDGTKPSYADSYVPKDTSGAGDEYARQNMSASQLAEFDRYGAEWNKAAAAEEQALASAKSEAERTAIKTYYGQLKDYWHQKKETLRGQYGYSGGDDGSEYIPTNKDGLEGTSSGVTQSKPTVTLPEATVVPESAKLPEATRLPDSPDLSGLKELPDATTIPDAPDFTSLLDQWLSSAQKQQESKIDYATQQGITELERAEQDAQQSFQTQRDQVAADEAKALDNQALYAQRRGDKGGIGAVQYAAVQNAAMEQRRTVNQAQTKLATDTARQIADLRSQGEFEKADTLLDITQTYLSKLLEVQQWNAEYSMQKAQVEESIRQWEAGYQLDVTQFEENISQWQASFQESIRQWEADYLESIRQWEAGFAENVRQWNADYALDVEKFYESKRQWEAEFAEGKHRWDSEFGLSEGSLTGNYKGSTTLDSQKLNNSTMAEAGWTMLQYGILPSESQLKAMGVSTSQAQEYLTALRQSQSTSSGGNNSGGKPKDDPEKVTLDDHFWTLYRQGVTNEVDVRDYLRRNGYTSGDAKDYAEEYIIRYHSGAFDLDTSEKRSARYNKLNDKAKELLSTIERKNDRMGVSGLTESDQTKLEQAVQKGEITEAELEIMLDLLGY